MSALVTPRDDYYNSLRRAQRILCISLCALFLLSAAPRPLLAAEKWQTPTPEELSMTSQPQVPGAAAVYLFREELADDNFQVHSVYVRLKILTDSGKDCADVELPYGQQSSISDIAGRTIQPDGTVVTFTGKPYTKTIVKNRTTNVQAKVFTLPAVMVGSILEYRYSWRYSDDFVYSPTWYLQDEYFLRKGHFLWKPFNGKGRYILGEDGNIADRIAWAPNLPEGAKVEIVTKPSQSTYYELDIHDVPPLVDEEHSPPMSSISMRVAFYYTGARTSEEYWRNAGKNWSKHRNEFIGPGNGVKNAVQHMNIAGDTSENKLKKIYASVMEFDNTDFSRQKDKQEAKDFKNTDDVLAQKRGSGEQLTLLFIAMARAAGLKASAAIVARRSERFFWPALLNFHQLEDYIAIVDIDGKPQFLDPADRYCPYGLLAWEDTASEGIRQTDGGSERVVTPTNPYTRSQIKRIGDLTMNPDGTVNGTVKFTLTGNPAIRWRQLFLRTDLVETQRALKEHFEQVIPKGLNLELVTLENIDKYEEPLIASYRIDGPLGTATSKRIIIPSQFFETQASPQFTATQRALPIDLRFGSRTSDAVRIILPPALHWEAPPAGDSYVMKQAAQYKTRFDQKDAALTTYRTMDIAEIFYPVTEYRDLHDFFAKVANSDGSRVLVNLPATETKGMQSKISISKQDGNGD